MGLRNAAEMIKVFQTDGHGSEITYLRLSHVARRFPPSRSGRPVHVATVTRWITEGVRLQNGSRLHLRGTRLPGRWIVEPEAVEEFIAALTADRSAKSNAGETSGSTTSEIRPSAARTAGSRRKAAERAARELDKLGIG